MPHPLRSVVALKQTVDGTQNAIDMVQDDTAGSPAGGPGIEAGGLFNQNTGTGTFTIKDKNGKTLYGPTSVTGEVKVDPVAHGVTMPLRVTVTSYANGGSIIVYWWVKK